MNFPGSDVYARTVSETVSTVYFTVEAVFFSTRVAVPESSFRGLKDRPNCGYHLGLLSLQVIFLLEVDLRHSWVLELMQA